METSWSEVKEAVRQAMLEELSMGRFVMAPRFERGKLILQPCDSSLKSKEIPVEVFFKKLTSVREKLRVLEQKLNNHPGLGEMDKAELQQYITRCYGSLTTFNILFAEDDDKFVGQKSDD
jgi:hypothetical protein